MYSSLNYSPLGTNKLTGCGAQIEKMKQINIKEAAGKFFSYTNLLFSLDYNATDVVLIIIGVFFSIAAGIPFPLLGIVFGELIDDLNSSQCSPSAEATSNVSDGVRQKVLYVIYITIANFCFIYIHCSCWCYVSERIARRYRRRYFESVVKQDASYIESLSSGDIVSRLVSDVETIQSGTSEKVGLVISTVSYFVASYVVAFIKVPIIAGILISVVPCFFMMSMLGYLIKRYAGRISTHSNAATSIASSSLSQLPLVHAFNANQSLEREFASHLSATRIDSLKKATTHAVQLGLLYFIAYSSNALAFWEGSRLIAKSVETNDNSTSVGAVYTVIFVLIDASFILSQVAPFVHVFASAVGAADRLLAVINRPSDIDGTSEEGDKSASFSTQDIVLHDVRFQYPSRPDAEVLKGVNFTIPPGKHTVVVGPSGGGKSTIVSLLERFYDPTGGEVRLGEQDFRNLNVRYLRGNVGLVQQEPVLLDRSILENIAYGLIVSPIESHQPLLPFAADSTLADLTDMVRSGTPESEALAQFDPKVSQIVELVRQAAARSNALSFIDELPLGVFTSSGTLGSQLSGGQRQRIALARALIRESSVLILDEATAALDSRSEKLIHDALTNLPERVTMVSITHRLATARNADKIIVLEQGKVAEEGTHAELVAKDGIYAEMIRIQTLANVSPELTPSESSIESEEIPVETDNSITKEASITVHEPKDSTEYSDEKEQPTQEGDKKSASKSKDKGKHSGWFITKFVFALLRPNFGYIALGLAAAVIIGGSYIAEAVIFGHTLGVLNPCVGAEAIRAGGELFGLLFFVMALIELFANLVSGFGFGWAAQKVLYRIQVLSLRSLLRQSISWHRSEGRTPGTLLSHITSDATALGGITGTTIGLLLAAAVNLVAGVVVSFAVAWKITIVLLPTIPVLLVSGFMKLRTQAQFAERHQKAFADATSVTVEAVDNLRLVSAFSLEKKVYSTYERALREPYDKTLRSIATGNVFLAAAFSVSNLVYALAYWWGTRQILEGRYTQTQLFIVMPALLFSTQSCSQMFALAPDISKAGIASTNVTQLLTTRSADEELGHKPSSRVSDYDTHLLPEKPHDGEAAPASGQSGNEKGRVSLNAGGVGVELRDVHFEYPSRPGRAALSGLNIKVQPGQFCALVGPSGSGKSTTFSMIERFYRPASGSVIIDGVDITRQLGTGFRDDIALVPQENVLFEGTVAFNIGLGGRPSHPPTQEEIEEACKMANIHDVIAALPDGYQTHCSHDGKQFSGGQRQRLSIARALVRQPRLLLLDESTSALDAESERRMQEALKRLQGRTTVIAIAHRLSSIQQSDRIFLIDNGRCAEQGTHVELIQRSEMYRTSVLHQSLNT